MKLRTHVYRLDYFYNIQHLKNSAVIESTLVPKQIIEITSALQFFLEMVDEENGSNRLCLEKQDYDSLLCKYYGCVEAKEKYKKYHKHTLNYEFNSLTTYKFGRKALYHVIDLYTSRQMSCSCADLLVNKHIIQHPQYENIKKDIMEICVRLINEGM